jgi:hypothetical protein
MPDIIPAVGSVNDDILITLEELILIMVEK